MLQKKLLTWNFQSYRNSSLFTWLQFRHWNSPRNWYETLVSPSEAKIGLQTRKSTCQKIKLKLNNFEHKKCKFKQLTFESQQISPLLITSHSCKYTSPPTMCGTMVTGFLTGFASKKCISKSSNWMPMRRLLSLPLLRPTSLSLDLYYYK